MSRENMARILLRVGLAFAFAYAAIAGFLTPQNWFGFAPVWVLQNVPEQIFMIGFGVVEIALAVLLLFLKRPLYPALVAAALLIGMVVFNLGAMDIVFRDVSLALMALSLAALSKR